MINKPEIDVVFDIAAGCARSCSDCVINFDAPVSVTGITQLRQLLLDLHNSGMFVGNLFLGPTDVFASSTMVPYDHPDIVSISNLFSAVILSTSLLGKPDLIRDHAKRAATAFDVPVKLAVPVDMNQLMNEKYQTHLHDRIHIFEQSFGRPIGTSTRRVYFVGNLPQLGDGISANVFYEFAQRWGVDLDIAVGHGRVGLGELRHILPRVVKFFEKRQQDSHVNFTARCRSEAAGVDLLYRNGELFAMPYLHDRIPLVHPTFQILKDADWTCHNMMVEIDRLVIDSMTLSSTMSKCGTCMHQPRCSQFMIPTLQKLLDMDTCIMPSKLMDLPQRTRIE